jgi:PAT family beta-lactamase induction signal transducer AmpG
MLGYGFAAGLPLPLSGFTFRQWLTHDGVSLGLIGLTANIGLSYTLKFLWSPLLDQVAAPGALARFGQRRGWLLTIQPLLALACVALALTDPAGAPATALAAAGLVAFLSASQDIVVDAWRIETFAEREQGSALAAYVWGYRAALYTSGAGAIALAAHAGWRTALLAVAALALVGPILTLLAREPAVRRTRLAMAGFGARLRLAVVAPLRDFWARPGAATILGFVALFKLGEAMAGVMTAPFYRHLGFDQGQVATAVGPFGLTASIAGYALGGVLVARLGVARALLGTGLVQTAAMAMYVVLAYSAGDPAMLYVTVVAENFAQGTADAAFLTYLSGLCSVAFTATQYALLSSIAALGVHTVGGLSGYLVEHVGWPAFYTITLFAACPAMALMLVLVRRFPPVPAPVVGRMREV